MDLLQNVVKQYCCFCWETLTSKDLYCRKCKRKKPYTGWLKENLKHKILCHGKYKIIEPLASGGFGITVKACHYVGENFLSIVIILLMLKDKRFNMLVLRKVANTLRDSVYEQILWAIDMLGLSAHFTATKSPLQITHKKTGQRIRQ